MSKEVIKDRVDLRGPIQYLEAEFDSRMKALSDIPEDNKERIYNHLVAPFVKALNILKSHDD